MIFLIEYDRPAGKIVTFRRFSDSERELSLDARLDLELDLHRQGIEHEVVLLEAESESALRAGYRRYFEGIETLLSSMAEVVEAIRPR